MRKAEISFVWHSIAVAAIFALTSSTVTFAAPYHYFQNRGFSLSRSVSQYFNPGLVVPNANASATRAPQMLEALAPISAPVSRVNGAPNDYIPAISTQGVYHWNIEKLPIKVFVGSGEGVSGFRPQFATYIRKSFDEWCKISQNKLAWVEVENPQAADITIKWTAAVTERPEGTEAGKTDALTRFNTVTRQGIIYGARMQFLTRMPDREFADVEVEKTCLHEVGHALGLQGHSPYRGDIMYYAVSPSPIVELSQRDITTLNTLYAAYPVFDSTVALQNIKANTNN